jgi:hypothetical protein
MQARIVETAGGARWLAEGWRLFRSAPLGWFAVVFLYLLLTQVVALLPVVGLAALMLVPVFTVGLMAAGRAVSRGAALEVGILFSGFRYDLRPQLVLGAVYVAGALLVVTAMRVADSDGVMQALLTGKRKPEEVQFTELFAPLATFALIYAPLTMMLWFAPPLAAWHATGALKALFFSFVACLMNWRAFLAYAGAIVLVALVLMALMAVIAISAAGSPRVASVLAVLFSVVLVPTLFASVYASYQDIFGAK